MISKLLVANRAEIAARVFRTARAMGISTVAVCSDADAEAGAPFIADADEAIRLPGAAPADTYLRADLILAAAAEAGADAIHPGYGFLSENAAFARACVDAGITFVGPPPEAIEAMGSKIGAKSLMAAAGVPVLEGHTVTPGDTAENLAEAAERIGYPVLVKASYGGGGRGMRIVRKPDALAEAVAGAQREAASAFGDGTVFLERYVESPRHVEVQILGDAHGAVVHLFERDCSIQRRHQKVIEEAPAPGLDPQTRSAMGAAAVAAGKAIGYRNAGTVEFVLDADGRFAFLEVNTRLQVEHPVTEAVTGLDLVRLQLLVAQGEPLPPDVLDARITGHAVEARLYAEDPAAGFMPQSGRLHRFRFPEDSLGGIGVGAPHPRDGMPGRAGARRHQCRVDAGFADGTTVTVHYDPMLAKVIAWAPTRAEACRRLAASLAGAQIHGVTTNRDLLVGVLRHPEFLAGAIDTGFLERHDPAALSAGGGPDAKAVGLHALAAALTAQAARREEAAVLPALTSGFRNVPSDLQRIAYSVTEGGAPRRVDVGYRLGAGGACTAELDGEPVVNLLVTDLTPGSVGLQTGPTRRRFTVETVGEWSYVDSPLGSSAFHELERLPVKEDPAAAGSLLAPMPGKVVRLGADPGDMVDAGAALVVLEAMKMEHAILAPFAGTVASVPVAVGDQVDTGQLLAVMATDAEAPS